MINDLKQRAYEQERSENFGQAIELYESVIDHREAEGLTHQDASVFLRIADLHLRRDQEEDAIEAFQRAGELYAREGLQPQAIAVYRRILRISPEHTEALWNLAWLHAEMGVMAEARDYVADYLETVDMERDWVEAKDFLRRLLDLSEDVAIGLRLAELQEEAGRHDEALETLERLDVEFGTASSLDEDEIRSRIEDIREEVVPEEERIEDDVSFEGTAPEPQGEEAAEPGAELGEQPSDIGESSPPEFGELGDEPATDGMAAGDRESDTAGHAEDYEEAEDDGEYDLEVGAEEGSLDDGFPFPDADEELENGTFDGEGFEEDEELPAADAREEDIEEEHAETDTDWSEPEADGEEDVAGDGFGDVEDEVERPPASFGDEVAAAGEDLKDDDEPAGEQELGGEEREDDEPRPESSARGAWETDESDDHWDEREEDEEEQMSTQSEDLPGGTAVEEERDTFDGDAPGQGDTGFGGPATGSGASDTAGSRDYEEEYGERAELRRGLDVLDELIELDPDRLDHYRRRVGYAERLDDDEELVESWLEMANTLRGRDSTRAARLVYEHVLGIDPEAERVQEGIEELDRRAREAVDAPELFPDVDAPAGPEADRSELARRVWPEMERVRGQVQWLQAAAEMLRSGEGGEPPAEAYVMAGRYYLAKDDVDEAIDVLSLALDRPDLDDADLADVLFQLGLSHYRIDDRGSARRYFDRVASRDEDFGTVCDWVLS